MLLDAQVEAEYDSDAGDEETNAKFDDVGDEAAVEFLMDSRMLHPLRELSNVQRYEFEFNVVLQSKDFEPQPRLVDMIRALRQKIEANRRSKQEALQYGRALEPGALK